ncbi:Cytochrome P450 18a1 [Fragariocoptes setiger]|uniref:Cytochrome P450 18a1 n=1 Tax=Fragariocoptes setiger TaxID=1670756 RepID=A0ABQ7SAJ5_9ACAR|nr:Cytochrome P450 18a1 [Fragariocoptes setiger]
MSSLAALISLSPFFLRCILVLAATYILIKLFLQHQKSIESQPPGPLGLPFVGFLPFVGQEFHVTLTTLSQKFGPVYQIHLGGIRVVVLNDAKLIREAFKQPVFSGRPDTQLTRILQGYGIVNSDGALWKEQRAFLHSIFRKLGAKSLIHGKNGLEAKIQCHVKDFISDLRVHSQAGQSVQVRPMIARAVSSVVGSLIMNLTYKSYEEKEKFDRLIELMHEGFRLFTIAMPLDFIPIFKFFPGVNYAYRKIKKNRAETSAFFQQIADEHRRHLTSAPTTSTTTTYDQQTGQHVTITQTCITNTLDGDLDKIEARDLVDAYIVQQKKHEKDGKLNYFSDQQLVQIMSDIFSAGLETVTSTIEWSVLFLMLNIDCQQRVQEEIDNVIGRDRMPRLDDLAQMPYTEATIYEVLRRSNVIALGNAHATLDDATISGYRIPKGTQVLPNLYGIHMNPELWEDPDKFDPTRFIVKNKTQKPDHFIPFSVDAMK